MSQQDNQPQNIASSAVAGIARPRGMQLVGGIVIAAASLLAYFPSLSGAFIFDDDLLLTDNALIKSSDGPLRFWYTSKQPDYVPLTSTTLWLEWQLWGLNPTGYHLGNLLLHVAACLLIWTILNRLSIPGGFLAALLFAVHPVNVESVAWIEQRKNTASMLLFLLSILWYLRAAEARAESEEGRGKSDTATGGKSVLFGRWYWLSLAAFALAMFSKGSVAVLPMLLLLIAWWQRGRVTIRDLTRCAPFFLISAVLTPIIIWFVTHDTGEAVRQATLLERLLQAGTVPWFYLSKALAPIKLLFFYPLWQIHADSFLWWLPLAASLAVTILLLWQLRRAWADWARPLLFAWGFFCLALALAMGFADPGYMKFSLVADHYQHIALVAVVALAAAGITVWHNRGGNWLGSVAAFVAVTFVCACAVLTWQQSRLYVNDIGLYEATLKDNPDCWIAQFNLANSLLSAGRPDGAIEHYRDALRVKPDYADARYNLGIALAQSGKMQEAIVEFEQTLKQRPRFAKLHNNFGNALLAVGRTEEAIQHYQQAIQFQPENGAPYLNLSNAYASLGRSSDATATAEQALEMARSRGDQALAKQFEDWLANFRMQQVNAPAATGPDSGRARQ